MARRKSVKWKAYDYKVQIGPGNAWVYRPLLEIEVASGASRKGRVILALIDSGTDGSVLHADIARDLQIDLSQCQRVKLGEIGSLDGYLSNVRLSVPDMKTTMNIPIVFAENLPFDGLLGQRHFFQRFKIRFEKDTNKFYLASS